MPPLPYKARKELERQKYKLTRHRPYLPDNSTALCTWCAVFWIERYRRHLYMRKCPDCGGTELERAPHFTHPRFARKWRKRQLERIQQLARLSEPTDMVDDEKPVKCGQARVIPPQLIIKTAWFNPYTGQWDKEVVSGPDWMGEARDDPHRSADEEHVARHDIPALIVPDMPIYPVKLNIREQQDIDRMLRADLKLVISP